MWEFLTGFVSGIVDLAETFMGFFTSIGNLINSLFIFNPNNMHSDINGYVTALIGTSSAYTDSYAYKVFSALFPITVIFLMIYFAMHITDLLMTDTFDTESLLKAILFLVMILIITENSYAFLIQLYEVIAGTTGSLASEMLNAELTANTNGMFSLGLILQILFGVNPNAAFGLDTLKDFIVGFIRTLVLLPIVPIIAILLLLMFVVFVVTVRTNVVLLSIKICLNLAFAPIAFVNCFNQDLPRTVAVRHFKRILSLFLQVPCILLMMKIILYVFVSTGLIAKLSLPLAFMFLMSTFNAGIRRSEEMANFVVGL